MTHANNAPWFTKAGAASSIIPISHFVGASIFALKAGGYGCLFSLDGIDAESRTDQDLDVLVRGIEGRATRSNRKALAFTNTRESGPASICLVKMNTSVRSRSLLQTIVISF